MDFREKLKFYREYKDISQLELAQTSGVLLPSIRKYETGSRCPKEEVVDALARALDISPNAFLEIKHDTVGDILAVFFEMARYGGIELHGTKTDDKYSADDLTFSFSHPVIKEYLAEWASMTESARTLRNEAKVFKEEEIQKPMLQSAENLERIVERTKINSQVLL